MIKEAIQYLKNLEIKPEDRIIEFGGDDRFFTVDHDGNVGTIKPWSVKAQEALALRTLTGLIDYVKANTDMSRDMKNTHYYLHIANPALVKLLGTLADDGEREVLALTAPFLPDFDFGYFRDSEEMIIALQSKFVKTKDRDIVLQVLGNLVEESVKNTGDDGISQSVVMRQGITSREETKVPNPVTLAPYRTFIEVMQPESKFIFRMKEGPKAAIFEADGGAWRNEAIANIKVFLTEHLSGEIENGKITILA